MLGAVAAARGVCAPASTLVGLVHEHLMPEDKKLQACLHARVAAFGPDGNLLVGLVGENVVSGLATFLVVLMGHGISIDDSLVETVPDYTKEQSMRATALARRLQEVVDAENAPPKDKGKA